MVEKGREIRDCNFERDTGIGDFTKRDSDNYNFFLEKWVENVQRESSCNLYECRKSEEQRADPITDLSRD